MISRASRRDFLALAAAPALAEPSRRTTVSIRGDRFFINGKPTYQGRTWRGLKYEEGYQCPPVNWTLNTSRKRAFFRLVKEITGS